MSLDPTNDAAVGAETARLSRASFIVGLLALMGGIAYGSAHPDQFFHSYLLAFMFWNGLAVGSLAVLMLQYLTGGAWGIAIRRELEASLGVPLRQSNRLIPKVKSMDRPKPFRS